MAARSMEFAVRADLNNEEQQWAKEQAFLQAVGWFDRYLSRRGDSGVLEVRMGGALSGAAAVWPPPQVGLKRLGPSRLGSYVAPHVSSPWIYNP